ncbi:MAG: twitching motility protein PilT [Limisphaerales bacterium]|jgi:twitching motility protein PilT
MSAQQTLDKILAAAAEAGASDIHMKEAGPVIFRIDGGLVGIEVNFPTPDGASPTPTNPFFEELKETIVPKHARAQLEKEFGGDFSYLAEGIGRFRVNLFLQRGTWAMAMRLVKNVVPSFEELGLMPVLKDIAESQRGIVLLAGSTGSGKSTTLAAMLEHLNENFRKHIVTLEDPIEFSYEDCQSIIEQREIGLDCLSFERGMKHALRQDPDIILVGEMRDATSFRTAMSAADTGHLVLSTVHTTNAATSVTRILDFFDAAERPQVRSQMVSTLRAVICQRIIPRIGGGVIPAQEIMINTKTVQKMIKEDQVGKLSAAIETGYDDGMQDFNKALLDLVEQGIITKEMALEKSDNARALEMNFQGIFLSQGSRILG